MSAPAPRPTPPPIAAPSAGRPAAAPISPPAAAPPTAPMPALFSLAVRGPPAQPTAVSAANPRAITHPVDLRCFNLSFILPPFLFLVDRFCRAELEQRTCQQCSES